MPMTEDQKQRLKQRLLAAGVAAVALAGVAYLIASHEAKPTDNSIPIQQQGNIYETTQFDHVKTATKEGDLIISNPVKDFGEVIAGKDRAANSFVITAIDNKTKIDKVDLPFMQEQGLRFDASSCVGQTLEPNQSCTVSFLFDPSSPGKIDSHMIIHATSIRSDGSSHPITATAEILAVAIAEKVEPPAQIATPSGPSDFDQNNADFLRRRQRLGMLDEQFDPTGMTFMGRQKPKDDDWASIGYKRNQSTFPVDMTHVVTMDKPIPAVVKIPIDTRYPSRAVASVERDIYGGDGRVVVIERGSIIIGTVGAIGSSNEEKVSITWERLQRPDGSSWRIEATSGDAMGRSGVLSHNDDRFLERFGMTVAATAVSIVPTLLLNGEQTIQNVSTGVGSTSAVTSQNAQAVAAQQFNSQMTAVLGQYFQEKLKLPPIRTVPVGTRITIFPTTDLWLKPVVPTDDMRAAFRTKTQQSAEYQAMVARAGQANRSVAAQSQPQSGQINPLQPNAIGTTTPGYLQGAGNSATPALNGLSQQNSQQLTPDAGPPSLANMPSGADKQSATLSSQPRVQTSPASTLFTPSPQQPTHVNTSAPWMPIQ